jgi:peptidoglycan/xylan/chitin deacetylase (PgdA/CDA1 family)
LRRLPPPQLCTGLTEGNGSILKGYSPELETALARSTLALDLRHPVLRVAATSYDGADYALIKLQASTRHTGSFDARALQEDAVAALLAAFDVLPDLEHIDIWAVVPSAENCEYGHIPVFSVSVSRAALEGALSEPRTAPNLLSRIGTVRLTPDYLVFAATSRAHISGALPLSAYDAPPASADWPGLVLTSERTLAAGNGRAVSLFEGRHTGPRMAALTIDDGPHPLTTPLMLAVLKRYGVHATFFLVGQKAEEYPELVRMIDRDGHEIGNHAYTNARAHQMTGPQILAELAACRNVVSRLTGKTTRFFRPPGGRLSEAGLHAVAVSEHTLALWTTNADDWLRPAPEVIAQNVLDGLEPGGVALMHQGSMESFAALPLILEGARAQGIELAPMESVYESGAAVISQNPPADMLAYLRDKGYRHQ